MTNVTKSISLPASTMLRTIDGKAVSIDWSKVPEQTLADILVGGAKIIMANTYNSGGKDMQEKDKAAQMNKRIESWYAGAYIMAGGGPRDSMVGDMKEAFVAKQVAAGKTVKEAEASIRDTVAAAFGKDEKATFLRFLDAVATLKAKQGGNYDDIRKTLEDGALKAAESIREARARAVGGIEIDIDNMF